MKIENTLVSCIITVKETNVNVRCLSHIAKTPNEVDDWVPVTLKELGDTIVIDKRTAEVMNGGDVEFILKPQTHQLLGVMVYNKSDDGDKDGGEADDLCGACEGSSDGQVSSESNM